MAQLAVEMAWRAALALNERVVGGERRWDRVTAAVPKIYEEDPCGLASPPPKKRFGKGLELRRREVQPSLLFADPVPLLTHLFSAFQLREMMRFCKR